MQLGKLCKCPGMSANNVARDGFETLGLSVESAWPLNMTRADQSFSGNTL